MPDIDWDPSQHASYGRCDCGHVPDVGEHVTVWRGHEGGEPTVGVICAWCTIAAELLNPDIIDIAKVRSIIPKPEVYLP